MLGSQSNNDSYGFIARAESDLALVLLGSSFSKNIIGSGRLVAI